MEKNNITVAPAVADVEAAYALWHESHDGTRDTFYRFMTTPSTGRDRFISLCDSEIEIAGSLATITLKNA